MENAAAGPVARPEERIGPRRRRARSLRAALARPLLRLHTLRMFRDDRLLLVATLLLSASALLPITTTPILPLVDLGSNIGAACLLDDAASGQGLIPRHYEVNPSLIPYWTVYLLIVGLEQLFGPLLAAKLVVGLIVVLLPIGVMRLLLALGRSPRLGLWAFMLTWDNNLYWGWITFQFGMGLALIVLAKLIELRNVRDAWRLLPLTVAVALTHLNAVALLLAGGGLLALVRRPFLRSLPSQALALSGCVLPIGPWIWAKLYGGTPAASAPFAFDMHAVEVKLEKLFAYTIDLFPEQGARAALLGFVLIPLGGLLFGLLPQRSVSAQRRLASLALLLAVAGLYFALPFAVGGPIIHWYTYPRYGTYLLIGLLLIPSAALVGRSALALLPGVLCAVALHQAVGLQFRAYGEYVTPYLDIIAHIPKNSRVLPLDFDDYRFRGTRQAVLGQLHGYAAAVSSSYDPHLFDEVNNPLHFRREANLPYPNWLRPSEFSMREHGRYYDYVIVHPTERDPLGRARARAKGDAELVREAGAWRLYRVKEPQAPAPRK